VGIQAVDATLAKALALPKAQGALVGEVDRGGPADRAGLKPGDVIISLDGAPVAHSQELPRMVARHAPGTKVRLTLIRDKQEKSLEATLDRLSDERQAEEEGGAAPALPKTGEMGITVGDAPGASGAVVQRVNPAGPAHDELEPGDVIVEVSRRPVHSASEAALAIKSAPADQPLLLTVKREGHTRFAAIDRK
jgi:serine protease Do